MPEVAWLSVAPVKGLALLRVDELTLERFGAAENRRFYVLDRGGRFVNALKHPQLFRVVPRYDIAAETLALRFPDGNEVGGPIELGDAVTTDFYGRAVPGRLVRGPFDAALSEYAGAPLRLVRTDEPGAAVDRDDGPVSLVSEESVAELARRAGEERVDERRFRMLIGIRGVAPHEEDDWVGRDVHVGGAVVHPVEQVARCAITTKDPDTGERDLDTLRLIKEYRGLRNGRHLDFGVYGTVVRAGPVRVGDVVVLLQTSR